MLQNWFWKNVNQTYNHLKIETSNRDWKEKVEEKLCSASLLKLTSTITAHELEGVCYKYSGNTSLTHQGSAQCQDEMNTFSHVRVRWNKPNIKAQYQKTRILRIMWSITIKIGLCSSLLLDYAPAYQFNIVSLLYFFLSYFISNFIFFFFNFFFYFFCLYIYLFYFFK